MIPFSESGLEVERVLEATVIGGNALSRRRGGTKIRRRVPAKQERLLRLVAEHGCVDFSHLVGEFKEEWKTIQYRRRGEYVLIAKRDFFRNIADLAGRINAALVAGYRDCTLAGEMTSLTAGIHLAVVFDHQKLEIGWADSRSDGDAPEAGDSGHVRLKPGATRTDEGEEMEPGPPAGPSLTASPTEAPPNRKERCSNRPSPDHRRPIPPGPEITVDPVTTHWILEIDGQSIELIPSLGYVKHSGQLLPLPAILGLAEPNAVDDALLRQISNLLNEFVWRHNTVTRSR